MINPLAKGMASIYCPQINAYAHVHASTDNRRHEHQEAVCQFLSMPPTNAWQHLRDRLSPITNNWHTPPAKRETRSSKLESLRSEHPQGTASKVREDAIVCSRTLNSSSLREPRVIILTLESRLLGHRGPRAPPFHADRPREPPLPRLRLDIGHDRAPVAPAPPPSLNQGRACVRGVWRARRVESGRVEGGVARDGELHSECGVL